MLKICLFDKHHFFCLASNQLEIIQLKLSKTIMKNLLLPIAMCSLFAVASFGQTVLLEEGFETDGHVLKRYTASSSGDTSHFRRTDGSDLKTSNFNPYREFSGTWFWATDDTDHPEGDRKGEQTIVFNPIDIAGVTGLSISGLFGAGNSSAPGEGAGTQKCVRGTMSFSGRSI